MEILIFLLIVTIGSYFISKTINEKQPLLSFKEVGAITLFPIFIIGISFLFCYNALTGTEGEYQNEASQFFDIMNQIGVKNSVNDYIEEAKRSINIATALFAISIILSIILCIFSMDIKKHKKTEFINLSAATTILFILATSIFSSIGDKKFYAQMLLSAISMLPFWAAYNYHINKAYLLIENKGIAVNTFKNQSAGSILHNVFFEKYMDFHGIATRKEFWITIIVFILVYIIGNLYKPLLIIPAAIAIPTYGVSVRRLHDTNKSGWNMLWMFLPIIGWIILAVFCSSKSIDKDNKYNYNTDIKNTDSVKSN